MLWAYPGIVCSRPYFDLLLWAFVWVFALGLSCVFCFGPFFVCCTLGLSWAKCPAPRLVAVIAVVVVVIVIVEVVEVVVEVVVVVIVVVVVVIVVLEALQLLHRSLHLALLPQQRGLHPALPQQPRSGSSSSSNSSSSSSNSSGSSSRRSSNSRSSSIRRRRNRKSDSPTRLIGGPYVVKTPEPFVSTRNPRAWPRAQNVWKKMATSCVEYPLPYRAHSSIRASCQ